MSPLRIILRELFFRKWNFILGLMGIALAVAVVSTTTIVVRLHEKRASSLLEIKRKDNLHRMESIRETVNKAMDRLGFNVIILPKEQDLGNWYSEDYASRTMQQSSIEKLKKANLETIRNPVARLRRRLKWPETKWTVILVGTEGRIPGTEKQTDIVPVQRGTVLLGHEIHQGLDINEGSEIRVMGTEFKVSQLLPQEGSKDDITIWMNLRDVQKLLDMKDVINEIAAVETEKARGNIGMVRKEIGSILPDTRAIEKSSETVASLKARLSAEKRSLASIEQEAASAGDLKRKRFIRAILLDATVIILSGIWIGLMAFTNGEERQTEIALWNALGVPFRSVSFFFWGKWILMGAIGTIAGFGIGSFTACALTATNSAPAPSMSASCMLDPYAAVFSLLAACILSGLAGLLPTMLVRLRDPAEILQKEQ